jgi:hypothetical protein
MSTMHSELFEPTIPFGEPEPVRAGVLRGEFAPDTMPGDFRSTSTEPAALSPSLLADLQRFEERDRSADTLGALAACVRHNTRVTLHLQCGRHVVPLTVFPREQLIHCPMQMIELLTQHFADLRVVHVESAWLHPPGSTEMMLVGRNPMLHPLGPFLWELAMRGARRELLPEIAGLAAYRIAPGLDLARLPVRGALLATLSRLRTQSANLRELADWPGLDRERAIRLLNALYLQAGLIVSRAHPDAARDSWFGALGR